jgi:glycosyltransferase involved in cell wall biosynthesis
MEVYQRLKELEGHGVTYVDGVGQWQLARMQLESGAMVYPCDPVAPTEGFSISILEAHAAGIPVVTTDADALPELWGESTLMLRRPFSDAELTDAIVSVLTDESLRAALQTRGLAKAQEYNWTDIGDAFYQALKGELGEGK